MEEQLLNIIAELAEDDVVKENLDVDLFDTGLIDSMAFIELLVEIDSTFNVKISPSEIDRTMMNTPKKIIEMIKSRM